MKLIKKNHSGMSLVEILVAMTIFSIMFMMVSLCMSYSVRQNVKTQNYDEEIDEQVEDAEKYNPMGAYIADVNGIDSITSLQKDKEIKFSFGSRTITVYSDTYQVDSRNQANGFKLKFFSNIKPDVSNGKYWVRLVNGTNSNKTICLYLPSDDKKPGSFYTTSGTEPFSTAVVKTIPAESSRSIGFNASKADDIFFYISEGESTNPESLPDKIMKTGNLSDYNDNGYIDIYYYHDDTGTEKFMTKTDYEYIINLEKTP